MSVGGIAWPETFFGPEYRGLMKVAIPEAESLNSPFTVYFNWDEHQDAAKVDIGPLNDLPGNAAYNKLSAAHRVVAARFPFGEQLLRKCPPSRLPL
jgi:hypothetical protein